jgi:hypothetical protein
MRRSSSTRAAFSGSLCPTSSRLDPEREVFAPMSPEISYSDEKLRYRRQFVIGPCHPEGFPSWTRVAIRENLLVTAHPELPVVQSRDGNRSVTLLGYILDSDKPEAGDREILDSLRDPLGDGFSPAWFTQTERLGGRWVLVLDDGKCVRLFQDAMGLREVHWADRSAAGAVWVATQPSILAEFLPLARDSRAEAEFIASSTYQDWPEYRWPGDTSAYAGVRRLLPNHALDPIEGRVERYWPHRPIPKISLEEGADQAAARMKRLIEAAARRFPLALATTAGWDTRLVLAASRAVAPKLFFFTRNRVENPPDVTTAPRLIRRLGFEPHLIPFPQEMSPEFGAVYLRNVSEAHPFWGRMAEGMYAVWPAGHVAMTGNAAEIVRVRIRPEPGEPVTGKWLARRMTTAIRFGDGLESSPFVVDAWTRWLGEMGELYNVELLDLFYWESYSGSFTATGETEYDIVQESFTPYDCRDLITTMLGVEEKYRDHDRPRLYREMIRRLWPDVMCEPVNVTYEGKWTPAIRAFRALQLSRLVPRAAKERIRSLLRAS